MSKMGGVIDGGATCIPAKGPGKTMIIIRRWEGL